VGDAPRLINRDWIGQIQIQGQLDPAGPPGIVFRAVD
jgi:hypothetical protein